MWNKEIKNAKMIEVRREVMKTVAQSMDAIVDKYLKSAEECWQPSDFLPDPTAPDFKGKIDEIQELAREVDYDLFAVLVGDTITEEALPTYESWLMGVEGVEQGESGGWSKWVRAWTAEENRHGDLLNRYLYLSGRVNMREMEISTQHLISDGFDIQTGQDPYKNFVYTSFQELATNISHRRVASLVKKPGNVLLAKVCGVIAADEARHANAYISFVKSIFGMDPSEMMLAFQDMMKKKIVMPAHFLRESGDKKGGVFAHFSDAAQRLGVYTSQDYIDILKSLLVEWDVDKITGLNDAAEKARDYVMTLPERLQRISDRIRIPDLEYKFQWIRS